MITNNNNDSDNNDDSVDCQALMHHQGVYAKQYEDADIFVKILYGDRMTRSK